MGEFVIYGNPCPAPIITITNPNDQSILNDGGVYQISFHADGVNQYFDGWQDQMMYNLIAELETHRTLKVKYVEVKETDHGVDVLAQFKYYGASCPTCTNGGFSPTVLPLIPIIAVIGLAISVIGIYLFNTTMTENPLMQWAIIIGVAAIAIVAVGYAITSAKGGQHYITPAVGRTIERSGEYYLTR